jgi:probable rRNA maturation factor
LPLDLTIFAAEARPCVPVVRHGIQGAYRILKPSLRALSLAILPAKRMSILHKRFLNHSGPTDVLTFELEHDPRGRPTSGEIVICSTVARVNAKKLGHPLSHELLLYALHGLLHLSGFDDRTASTFAAMHAKEDEILTRLGIGPVFATGARKCPSI